MKNLRATCATLHPYARFERATVVVLGLLIALVILIALLNLGKAVVSLLLPLRLNPLEHMTFQNIFGEITTVLIALEFRHSILKPDIRSQEGSAIQVRTVMLIAILAIARKFIILDLQHATVAEIYALTATVVGLGIAYWVVRDSDRRVIDHARQQEEVKE
ncbi:phosphate-starvation-inducible PsiE family protein [Burkholderia diffusa]|uniref:phosphate-starvation-inducible PsiE family protein n=1 Tax=Burkholderia diffusa TaxID=488732 RepID=UPI001ABAD9E5|nr:phosphate-starvation-inducible PsiE family protein [Burkholderia diffusa]